MFHGLFIFYKKMKKFSRPVFFFFLPRFQRPVGAMYQSVGKCFRMHLRAAGIHKIAKPLADFLGLGWRLDRYADISGWLEPWIT